MMAIHHSYVTTLVPFDKAMRLLLRNDMRGSDIPGHKSATPPIIDHCLASVREGGLCGGQQAAPRRGFNRRPLLPHDPPPTIPALPPITARLARVKNEK